MLSVIVDVSAHVGLVRVIGHVIRERKVREGIVVLANITGGDEKNGVID